MYSGEYAKHLRKYGKRAFWRAYRRMVKVNAENVVYKKECEEAV